ncbi:glycosyltransferase [Acinetobacter sp. MD2(2019)]|uniref:glycosyltransferase n=1 Tax=Acinetobacter sp. MD2(2019) TaxID=2605273 RepID=UPI002D1ED7D4|nr:glycosyltransferase [Acinetobacter sp. MD2(2019)]MEB3754433.1 glycosyltransferase [Acinetobacter sp. MD2(2019)]
MINKIINVSLVIYQHAYEDVSDAINNLLCSPYLNRLIIIDNDECDWVEKLNDPRIFYIKSEKNNGFGCAHNLAIKRFAHECEFFLICNPDIYFDQEDFNLLVDFAIKNKDVGLFLPKIIYPDGTNQFGARLLPSPINLLARRFIPFISNILDRKYLLKDYDTSVPCAVPNLSGCFMFFRSKPLIELGGFDERFFMYMEDIDLSRRCVNQFGGLYYPLAQVTHVHSQGSYKNKKLLKVHLKSAIQYFNKWGWVHDPMKQKLNQTCILELGKSKHI